MSAAQKSYWLKSGLFSILEKGSVFIFGFGGIALLARGLTLEAFGVWAVFNTVTAFFEVARIGLQQNALVKFLSTHEGDDAAKIGTASMFNNILLTTFSVLILFSGSFFIGEALNAPALGYLLRIYCLTTILLIPFQQFNFTQQAKLDFTGIFWSNFASKGSFFIFILGLFLFKSEMTLEKLAYCQIFTAIVGSIVSYTFARKYLEFSPQIDWAWVKQLFNFGRFVFGTNLSTMLYKNIDKLMLSAMIGPEVVGVYDLAIKVTNLVEVPTFSIASVVYPQSARQMLTEGKTAVKRLYEKSVGAIMTLILPFLAFIFLTADYIILLMGTDKFTDSVAVLRITILFGLFIPFAIQFGTAMDSMGKPKMNFRLTITMALLNAVLNYVFISQMGVIGAAYGTLLAWFIVFVLGQWILYRTLNVRFYNVFLLIPSLIREGWQMVQKVLNKNKTVSLKSEL